VHADSQPSHHTSSEGPQQAAHEEDEATYIGSFALGCAGGDDEYTPHHQESPPPSLLDTGGELSDIFEQGAEDGKDVLAPGPSSTLVDGHHRKRTLSLAG
jgi:hypothetical protein